MADQIAAAEDRTGRELHASPGQYHAAMHLTDAESGVIQACTSYVEAGNYLRPDMFQRERQQLFGKLPLPAAMSAELPKPGSYMGVDLSGTAVLLTRGKGGQVKAFLNACSHRGARLATEHSTAGLKLSCPYHAWSYNLDGKLIGVPREECFAQLDKSAYGLRELPCREAGGVIWVSLDRGATMSDEFIGRELIGDFDAMRIGRMRVYKTQQFEIRANWKLITDAFLEGYHVIRLHAKTLARFFVDAPQSIERIGRHLRQTSGSRRGFSPEEVSPLWPELRKAVVYAYIGFPTAVVVTSPSYVSVVLMSPQSENRTKLRYMMLVDGEPGNPKLDDLHKRSFALMSEAFGNEDFHAAELSQQGLETGALQRLTLGGMEQGVRAFHDVIEEYVSSCAVAG